MGVCTQASLLTRVAASPPSCAVLPLSSAVSACLSLLFSRPAGCYAELCATSHSNPTHGITMWFEYIGECKLNDIGRETNTLISEMTTVICLDDFHSNDRAGRKVSGKQIHVNIYVHTCKGKDTHAN